MFYVRDLRAFVLIFSGLEELLTFLRMFRACSEYYILYCMNNII